MSRKPQQQALVPKAGSELIQHVIAYEHDTLPEIHRFSEQPALIVCEFDGAMAFSYATWYHACLLSKKMSAEDQLDTLAVLQASCLPEQYEESEGRIDLLVISHETLLGYCVALSELPLLVHWLCKPGLLGGIQWHPQTKINLYKQKPRPRNSNRTSTKVCKWDP